MPARQGKNGKQQKNQDGLGAVLILRAENETRTRDPDLGKVVLYQLSYFRRSRLESP